MTGDKERTSSNNRNGLLQNHRKVLLPTSKSQERGCFKITGKRLLQSHSHRIRAPPKSNIYEHKLIVLANLQLTERSLMLTASSYNFSVQIWWSIVALWVLPISY